MVTSKLELNALTETDFKPLISERFTMMKESSSTFELLEVSLLGSEPASGNRQAFSLLFRGEATTTPQQNIYELEHEKLGQLELFLVPVGPDDKGMLYEAVFT